MAKGARDAGPNWDSVFGVSGARFTSANQSGSAAAVTDAPTTGKKLVVDDLIISVDTNLTVTFTEETAGTVLMSLYILANSVVQITTRGKLKIATVESIAMRFFIKGQCKI